MPVWATTLIGYIGKGLAALFAGATAALGSVIAVLVQLTALATGLAAFGVVLGINARQSN